MDIIPEAIEDAKRNAKEWDLTILIMKLERQKRSFLVGFKEGYRADALIVDPPRTGLDDKLLDTILTYVPEKMVYISCNVSTLGRGCCTPISISSPSSSMFPRSPPSPRSDPS